MKGREVRPEVWGRAKGRGKRACEHGAEVEREARWARERWEASEERMLLMKRG